MTTLVRALWVLAIVLLVVMIVTGYLAAWHVGGRTVQFKNTAVLSMLFAVLAGLAAALLKDLRN